MEYKQIQELIKTINKSNISELNIEQGDFKITIKQEQTAAPQYVVAPQAIQAAPVMAPAAAPTAAAAQPTAPAAAAAPAAEAQSNQITIKCPIVGTFYRAPSQDKPVFVNVGDEVKKEQVLCIIEAMKIFNEIECEMDCRIVKVLVDNETPVEYDQPLFIVEPM